MKTNFVARTAEEAQQIFGGKFYMESRPTTQTQLDERVQLGAFLQVYALSDKCSFPIEVDVPPRHQRPDFKVTFRGREIGIETSKIANWELEEIRTVQRQKGLGTIEISSLLQPQPKRTRNQKISDCTGVPVFIFGDPNQLKYEDDFWLQQAQGIIMRKHAKTKEPTFNRYAASWLLLWDKLSYEEELEPRISQLAIWLASHWQNDFFEKVIVQQQHSERFFLLSQQRIEVLQQEPKNSVTEFNLPADLSLGVE